MAIHTLIPLSILFFLSGPKTFLERNSIDLYKKKVTIIIQYQNIKYGRSKYH